jgi:hypothetical protein
MSPVHPPLSKEPLNAEVARVTVYPLVVISDQVAHHGDIGNVVRGDGDTVGEFSDLINGDMGLHAEIPLVALLGLLYLQAALLGLVLGGERGGHDGGVDDGALAHEQLLLGQAGVDLLEDPLGQGMFLQQVTETQQRGGVRHALDGQVDTDEVTHGLAIVDIIFERLVGEGVPLLQEVDPQRALQANGRPAPLACRIRKVGRRQCIDHSLPWHQGIHLGQEPLSAGNLLLASGAQPGRTRSASSGGSVRRWQEGQIIPRRYQSGSAAGFLQRFLRHRAADSAPIFSFRLRDFLMLLSRRKFRRC